jgi:predicted Zn-dependent protease
MVHRHIGPFRILPLLLLAACANNSALFESGLKDANLGKPVIEETANISANVAPASQASLDEYRFDNVKPMERPDPATDEGGLWLALDNVEAKLKLSGGRITDPKLNAYVKDIVCQVTGPYCRQIRVYVMRLPIFNASMSPNGMMQVNSGLLLRCRNEAEMVSVLGHEFGHFLRRHSLQRQRDAVAKTSFLAFTSLALVAAGAPAGTSDLMSIATFASMQAYSRDHEREADGYGLRILFDRGYDVHAGSAIWERLIKETKLAEVERGFNPITASHPADNERVDELERVAKMIESNAGGSDRGRERFLAQILPHRAAFIEDEISKTPQKHAHALLDVLIEDGVRLGELYYFKGEVHRRSADKEAPQEALKFYEKAILNEGTPVQTYKSKAFVLLALGRKEDARKDFETYLKMAPTAQDAQLVRMQIEELK